MATTENKYTANGSDTQFVFTFPFLATTDIKVSLNQVLTTAFTVTESVPTLITFNTAPANGTAVRIFRETNPDATLSKFFSGSSIPGPDLNDNFDQALYINQELLNEFAEFVATGVIDNSVTTSKIADGAVVESKLASNSVTTAKIVDANVTTAKVADAAITPAKLSIDYTEEAPSDGKQYARKDDVWSEVLPTTSSGDSPPANPTDGLIWYDSDSGKTFVYYVDTNSSQWVEMSPSWTGGIADDAVTTVKLQNNAVTTAKIADDAVTTAKLDPAIIFVPTGTISAFGGSTAPTGYLECNGQSTSGYAALAAVVGSNVPDLRGEFIRGWDNGRGVDSGRNILTAQGEEYKSHNHTSNSAGTHNHSLSSIGNHTHTYYNRNQRGDGDTDGGTNIADDGTTTRNTGSGGSHSHTVGNNGSHSHTINASGGAETRPRNISLLYIIKT